MNIEKRVADTILQRKNKITLHGITYDVEQPTIATLIAISELVAELPYTEDTNPLNVLKDLKDSKVICDVMATLILGVKKRKWYHFAYRMRFKRLSSFILNNCSPAELCAVLGDIMQAMQLTDFFVLTASLKGVSLTRVADKTTIQSGQSLQE